MNLCEDDIGEWMNFNNEAPVVSQMMDEDCQKGYAPKDDKHENS